MSLVANVLSKKYTSISEFKTNPNSVIKDADGEAVAVMKSNKLYFYAVPADLFEEMYEAMENLALLTQANERLSDGKELIDVNLDDL